VGGFSSSRYHREDASDYDSGKRKLAAQGDQARENCLHQNWNPTADEPDERRSRGGILRRKIQKEAFSIPLFIRGFYRFFP
jgi:hypothetical protein